MTLDIWDEEAIEQRGRELFELAKTVWPGATPI